jgi:hypothetical protein
MLDTHAANLNQLLVTANGAALEGDKDAAIVAITNFADVAFTIDPFTPDDLPSGWRDILRAWLKGEMIADFAEGPEDDVLQFVEKALVYRLPWAMEAVRVRALANRDSLENGILMEELELGLAVAAVETGTLNRSAAILMHAGFSSRVGAIRAVEATGADFASMRELRRWLRSQSVVHRVLDPDWPTAQSHSLWLQFIENLAPARHRKWIKRQESLGVQWDDVPAENGTPVRLREERGLTLVLSADFTRLGRLREPINPERLGIVQATVADENYLDITYLGPNDLKLSE